MEDRNCLRCEHLIKDVRTFTDSDGWVKAETYYKCTEVDDSLGSFFANCLKESTEGYTLDCDGEGNNTSI